MYIFLFAGKEKKRRGSIIDIGSGKESIQDDSESGIQAF